LTVRSLCLRRRHSDFAAAIVVRQYPQRRHTEHETEKHSANQNNSTIHDLSFCRTTQAQRRRASTLRSSANAEDGRGAPIATATARRRSLLAHKLARILWHLLKYKQAFKPEVFAQAEEKMNRKKLARLQKLAAALNYQLIPNP